MLNKKEPGSVNNSLPDSLSVGYRLFNNRLPGEFVGDFAELFRSQLELFAVEIDVIFVLDGDQMDVRMGNFHAQDDHCAQSISRLIRAATFLAKTIIPASVSSSRSNR